MPYTVKQLAEISGVSVRTLHYYDEIRLLNPAYIGENKYRYYEEEQLLQLQQILFYRELGIALNDIQKILTDDKFDRIEALLSHKKRLKADLDRTQQLIKTIDKTIKHIRGNKMTKLEDIFEGFDEEKQQLYENFLVESGVDQTVINSSKQKTKNWSKEQWLANKADNDKVYIDLAKAIDENLEPSSPEVQHLIQRHYELTKIFWQPNRESYIGLSQLYCSHPDFVAFYNSFHPKLLDFLVKAMKVFAENQLS